MATASSTPPPDPAKAPANKDDREKPATVPEVGGALGPDPTRYGDWQHKGRVSDF